MPGKDGYLPPNVERKELIEYQDEEVDPRGDNKIAINSKCNLLTAYHDPSYFRNTFKDQIDMCARKRGREIFKVITKDIDIAAQCMALQPNLTGYLRDLGAGDLICVKIDKDKGTKTQKICNDWNAPICLKIDEEGNATCKPMIKNHQEENVTRTSDKIIYSLSLPHAYESDEHKS